MANADFITKHIHIIPRQVAKSLGMKRYFTGGRCVNGHIWERLTSNGSCLLCSQEKARANYRVNPSDNLAKQKIYREKNREHILARRLEVRMRDKEYAERRAERERISALRSAAIASGEKLYSPGTMCPKGHIAPRFTADGKCSECNRISCRERYKARMLAAGRSYRSLEEIMRVTAEKRVRVARQVKQKRDTCAWHIASRARREAIEKGYKTYFSPKPCPKGHISERYTSSGSCVTCLAEIMVSPERKKYDRQYYRSNVERIRVRSRAYAKRNHKRVLEKAKEWARANREKRRAIADNYKHRRRAWTEGGVSTIKLYQWKRSQKKVCYWCNANCRSEYHVDHYVPLSRGGAHELDNLVIACPSCNHRKSAKDPLEFAAEVGRLF